MACYILTNTFSPCSVFPGKRKACSVEGKKDSPSPKHGSTYFSGAKQVHPHLSYGGP